VLEMDKDAKIILSALPRSLESDIKSIFDVLSLETELYNGGTFEIRINDEIIHIPERIYYEEPKEIEEMKLSYVQRQIIDCIFTRHHDGYVRQKRLNSIFKRGIVQKWIIPYIIRLAGEYLVEIIEDIYSNIHLIPVNELEEFINKNQKFMGTTKGRIASYWGEYYMGNIKKNEYIGFKLKNYLESLNK
jgi:hypothetical protein